MTGNTLTAFTPSRRATWNAPRCISTLASMPTARDGTRSHVRTHNVRCCWPASRRSRSRGRRRTCRPAYGVGASLRPHDRPRRAPAVLLDEVYAHDDAGASQARLITFTNSAAFALPNSRLEVSIAGSVRPRSVGARARLSTSPAGWRAPCAGRPARHPPYAAPRCRRACRQPMGARAGCRSLRAWPRHSAHPSPVPLSSPSSTTCPWDTLGLIRSRLETTDVLASADHAFFRSGDLAARWTTYR